MLIFHKALFLVLLFLCYKLVIFLMILFTILPSRPVVLYYSWFSPETPDFWQQLGITSEHESDLGESVNYGIKWLFWLIWQFSAIDVKIGKKSRKNNHLLRCVDCYIVLFAKTASKKIVALIHAMKFLSSEFIYCTVSGLSMNILQAGNKLPM